MGRLKSEAKNEAKDLKELGAIRLDEIGEAKDTREPKEEKEGAIHAEGGAQSETVKKEPLTPEKAKALDLAMKQIKKDFGDGSIMKLGESQSMVVETISTGSLNLNMALGVGGVPRGRIIEVYGAESSGKTTIALHILAEAQKTGGIGAFIDAEHALDP
ncbi:MAG: DNA recombination/repair protein RecA, partial [Fusobacteriaceae bacterium]|nr:DNA recombination/repair protein RecA [Fusobacteriaceae bacterium]